MGRRPSGRSVNLTKVLRDASRGAFQVTGPELELDIEGFRATFADTLAEGIRANLGRGVKPDGRHPMPARKETPDGRKATDRRPRGLGARILDTIRARATGSGYVIAADESTRGHLSRILKRIPLRPAARSPTWQAALAAALEVLTGKK